MAQAKAMNSTWLTACGGGAGRVSFQGAKKRPAEGKKLNSLVAKSVKSFLPQTHVKMPSPQVTPAQKTSRSTSTLKPSILGVNDKNSADCRVMTRKFGRKTQIRKSNYIQ